MRKKQVNIAIIGLGNIGGYLYKYLKANKKVLAKKQLYSKCCLFVCKKQK